jgi:hypothetical protein
MLTQQWGQNASYLGPARYQNFNLLGFFTPNRNRKSEKWSQFLNFWNQQQQNLDNSPINLQQAISELSDRQRDTLREIVNILLGVDLDIRQTVADNSMSQKYISCGEHNISYTSSGFRLITTLVIADAGRGEKVQFRDRCSTNLKRDNLVLTHGGGKGRARDNIQIDHTFLKDAPHLTHTINY